MESLLEGQIRLIRLEESVKDDAEDSANTVTALLSEEDVYHLELKTKSHGKLRSSPKAALLGGPADPPPPYIALSYTWGTARVPLDVRRNGAVGTAQVSPNCIHALEQIHAHFPDIPVWTDTLSIDQGNLPEKAHQISLMGKIYKSAWKVAVWLGSADYSDLTATYEELTALAQPYSNAIKEDKELSARRWALLKKIGEIDWFYRAWTFQEIRLAEDAVVLFGHAAVPWEEFIDKIQMVKRFEPFVSTVALRSQPAAFGKFSPTAEDRFFVTLDELNSGSKTDLAGLLFLTWYRHASEERDKIYAVLGSHLLDSPPHGLRVDYDISWSALCIKTARAAINTSQSLKILRIAGMHERWKNPTTQTWNTQEFRNFFQHPSWAPDWWRPPVQTRSMQSLMFDGRGYLSELNFCCPLEPAKQDVENTSPLLSLSGVLLGLVEIDNSTRSANIHAPPMCARFIGKAHASPTNSDVVIPEVPMYAFVAAVEKHLHGDCSCNASAIRGTRPVPQPFHRPGPPSSKALGLKFGNEKFSIMHVPRPDETAESAWPAQTLAKSVESGDWIVLLEGGGLPFILRPAKDSMSRIVTVRDLQSVANEKHPLPLDAACFVLVGEASMCWDQLWRHRWSTYCRLGKYVII